RNSETIQFRVRTEDVERHAVLDRLDILCLPFPKPDARRRNTRQRFWNDLADDGAVDSRDDQARTRYDIDQPPERRADRIEIRVDVGVIEFNVLQQNDSGQVMKKLRSLVEECRVVFIAFDNEVRPI